MNLLQDIFLYFAKYPSHEGVLKTFVKGAGDDRYNKFKKAVEELPVKDRFPQISNYVFGVNEDTVKNCISNISDTYLFVDYGGINSLETDRRVKMDNFHLAITIARPTSSATFELPEEVLMIDDLLAILCQIREDMRNDKDDPFIKRLVFPTEITPFFARELSGSYGWTLMFQLQGVDLV